MIFRPHPSTEDTGRESGTNWNAIIRCAFSKRGITKFKESTMNNDLTARLSTASSDLTQRALQIGQSGPERDTALMMQGLATAIEAI